jgi:hypothetical protein
MHLSRHTGPRCRPARPGGAAGRHEPAPGYGVQQEALFTDGEWRPVLLRAKARDSEGGWRVLVRWFDAAGGGTHEDWLVYDRYQVREPGGQ